MHAIIKIGVFFSIVLLWSCSEDKPSVTENNFPPEVEQCLKRSISDQLAVYEAFANQGIQELNLLQNDPNFDLFAYERQQAQTRHLAITELCESQAKCLPEDRPVARIKLYDSCEQEMQAMLSEDL